LVSLVIDLLFLYYMLVYDVFLGSAPLVILKFPVGCQL